MITVAVTGGIGSGKSTVSGALGDRGAVVVDSDQLARQVVAPGTPGLAAIADAFGPTVIGPDGALDRAALASVVFADPDARKALERITHPLVRSRFTEIQRQAAPDAVVVNDIPLLTTLAAAATFHLVVGVRADPELRVQRLIARGLAEADARARMAAQLTDEQRAPLCDVVLVNHGNRDELDEAVAALWRDRLLPFADNTRAGRRAERGSPRLVEPEPRWPDDARRLAARISRATGGARVDHIGSTAIPGMPAKDVIDLQLTVPSLDAADEFASALVAAGFPRAIGFEGDTAHPPGDDPARWVKRLHTNADPGQSVNLHVRVRDWPNWRWALLFRDWLASDPVIAGEYLTVKRSAVEHAGGSIDSYVEQKEPWIAKVYPRGIAWAASSGWSPDPPGPVDPHEKGGLSDPPRSL
jgi:dephospho-CoA kinase